MNRLRGGLQRLLQALRRSQDVPLAGAALLLLLAAVIPALPLPREVVNHLVIFDITQSMYVSDQTDHGRSVSRLDFTKTALISALGTLPCGSQLGLGIFASRRTLLLLAPIDVCTNRAELVQAIGQIDARMAWEDASVIARGVYSATDVAFELPGHPSVIFMTDGQESPPMATIPEFDRPRGRIKGTLIGVGGDIPLPIPRLDKEGRQTGWWNAVDVVQQPTPAGFAANQEHLSSLHAAHLQALAQAAGLGYARLDSTAALAEALRAPALARRLVVATDVRAFPALLALCLLLWHYARVPAQWHMHRQVLLTRLRQWCRLRGR